MAARKKKKKKTIRISIPADIFSRAWKAIKNWFKAHAPKLGVSVLLIIILMMGAKLMCAYTEKDGLRFNFDYEPPDPKKVRELINK